MTIYHETTVTGAVNGIPVDFAITVTVDQDYLEPEGDFDFGDEAENARYLAKFKSGELFMGVISVIAKALGCEGSDYLGGCHLATHRNITKEVLELVTDHDMINNAIAQCVMEINEHANLLAPYATKAVQP